MRFRRRSPPFHATFKGRDVFAYQQVPRSGVRYHIMLEWFLAARWAGLGWFDDFDQLDGEDMAFIVAAYRTHQQIEAVVAFDAHKRRKR
jgi:hypothetical protein